MRKITLLIMMILSLLVFNGCSSKEDIRTVFKDKLVCNEQLIINRPKADLRVKKDDVDVALAFKNAINSSFDFYENQVDKNNKLCEEMKNNENIK